MRVSRTAETAILPIWRSDIQPVILHRLSLGVDRTAAEIAASAHLNPIVVARHVRPLIDTGIVTAERVGRANVLRLNLEHPATAHLVALANLTVGLLTDLAGLHRLAGVRRVVVFGSWARRHHGEPGPPPRDVDVFVETDAEVDSWPIREACLAIAGRHQVAVDPTILPGTESAEFVKTHLDGPTIIVDPPQEAR